ncbi:HD domain-containing phosphohydrolase [Sulfurimonas sp. HSL-1716]|uniref:HD-GYP domain-containing protein n=1 Tax=Hydrocurvibacter sulfurireducens TaxID=3131937 RepID=UPI0031F77F52
MTSVKYVPIDKSILKEGMQFEFDILIPSDANEDMRCFKENGTALTSDDKSIIDTVETFYIDESKYKNYQLICKTLLPADSSIKNVSFTEKSASMYKNAAAILNKLFEDPDDVSNYETCKEVVNELIETVTAEDFTIKSLMSVATQDYYIHTHSINVAIYSLSLGAFLRLKPNILSQLGEAALLHDLGKSKIPPEIVNKNGELNDEEYEKMKKHPAFGYTIALKLGIKNKNILQGIRHHHERMNGAGYPFKMKGEEIPPFARIIGICDIFDALTSKKSYKEQLSTFDALKLMKTKMKDRIDIKLLTKMIIMFK